MIRKNPEKTQILTVAKEVSSTLYFPTYLLYTDNITLSIISQYFS